MGDNLNGKLSLLLSFSSIKFKNYEFSICGGKFYNCTPIYASFQNINKQYQT